MVGGIGIGEAAQVDLVQDQAEELDVVFFDLGLGLFDDLARRLAAPGHQQQPVGVLAQQDGVLDAHQRRGVDEDEVVMLAQPGHHLLHALGNDQFHRVGRDRARGDDVQVGLAGVAVDDVLDAAAADQERGDAGQCS